MMSEISSRKFFKIEAAQIRWLPAIISVVGFFLYPVYMMFSLSNINSNMSGMFYAGTELINQRTNAVYYVLGTGNYFSFIALTVGAFLAAIACFSYLTGVEKMDFYHSLAITRSQLFYLKFTLGWLSVAVPYICCVLLAYFAVGGAMGAVTLVNTGIVARAVCVLLLTFTAVYAVCVLAMHLTGRIFTGILIGAMLLFYGPICYYLIYLLLTSSYVTFLSLDRVWNSLGLYLSPATAQFIFADGFRPGTGNNIYEYPDALGSPLASIFVILLFAVAAFVTGLRVCQIRKSEVAGEALITTGAERWIKVLVSIPGGAYFGMFIGTLFGINWAYDLTSKIVCIVFAFIGAFLIGAIVEFIFTTDLRNIWEHWKSALISVAGAVVLLAVFAFDLTGFDTYFPEESQVEKIAVLNVDGENAIGNLYVYDYSNIREMLQRELTEDTAEAYRIADLARETTLSDSPEHPVTLNVLFQLQNGKEKYRSYQIESADWENYLQTITSDPENRTRAYKWNLIQAKGLRTVNVYGWDLLSLQEESIDMQEKDAEELLQALRQDTEKYSLEDLEQMKPIGVIELMVDYRSNWEGEYVNNYVTGEIYVYDTYMNTIAWLTARHADDVLNLNSRLALPLNEESSAEAKTMGIVSLSIYPYASDNSSELWITDWNQIEEVLQNVSQIRSYESDSSQVTGTVYISTSDGSGKLAQVRFLDEKLMESLMQ